MCQSEHVSLSHPILVFFFVFFLISFPFKMRHITLLNYVSHVLYQCLKHSKHSINVYHVNEDVCVSLKSLDITSTIDKHRHSSLLKSNRNDLNFCIKSQLYLETFWKYSNIRENQIQVSYILSILLQYFNVD